MSETNFYGDDDKNTRKDGLAARVKSVTMSTQIWGLEFRSLSFFSRIFRQGSYFLQATHTQTPFCLPATKGL